MQKGYTLVQRNTITYEWKIQEMSLFIEASNTSDTEIKIQSPKFSTKAKVPDVWNLQLRFNHRNSDHKDEISIFLNSFFNYEVRTEYSFYILNNEKKKVNYLKLIQKFKFQDGWGVPFIKKQGLLAKKNELLPDDILTIGIELTVFDDPVEVSATVPINESKATMARDYEELYKSKMGFDIELIVEEEKFQAHKLVLMARSSVFRAMLTTDMRENREKTVTIKDMKSEVFKKTLEFIYTDKVDDLDSFAEQLLEAADRFHIPTLKEVCVESLCESVTINNACRLLVVAHLHNATEMVEYISKFIAIHAIHVVKTEDYMTMKVLHPSLGFNLFDGLVTSPDSK
ncbi:speckle-type POZ protein B-like [Microplitis mediator]|uniref:speckle-type POZ protein B-like n=1 Tax=Microplitis mediator TaxID=375433 RepID=UPI0025566B5C|nr:speckle-type POZ protein B-like [Microplitis mediator]